MQGTKKLSTGLHTTGEWPSDLPANVWVVMDADAWNKGEDFILRANPLVQLALHEKPAIVRFFNPYFPIDYQATTLVELSHAGYLVYAPLKLPTGGVWAWEYVIRSNVNHVPRHDIIRTLEEHNL